MKPPPAPMQRTEQADEGPDHQGRDGADVELRAVEPHLERQAVDPVVLPGAALDQRMPGRRLLERRDAFDQHQSADDAEERDIAKGHEQIEMSIEAQDLDDIHADDGPDAPPESSTAPILMSTLLRRYWLTAPDTDDATICAMPVPTATAAGMPEKMSSGVMQKAAADTEQAG